MRPMKGKPTGKQISEIYRHMQVLMNRRLKQYGIGSGQYLFLFSIIRNQGITQKDLSAMNNVDKATTAKAVNKLIQTGFVVKLKEEEDRRFDHLHITPKGQAIIPELVELLNDIQDLCIKGISQENQRILTQCLNQVFINIQDELK